MLNAIQKIDSLVNWHTNKICNAGQVVDLFTTMIETWSHKKNDSNNCLVSFFLYWSLKAVVKIRLDYYSDIQHDFTSRDHIRKDCINHQ